MYVIAVLGLLLSASGSPTWGSSPELACSKRLERAATRAARARLRVLGRCMAEATACAGALDVPPGAAADGCATLAGARCRARLDALARFAQRMDRAAGTCLATIGADALLKDEIGYSGLAPLCPWVRLRAAVPEDASVCHAAAVACTASAAVAAAAPRLPDVLGRAGVSFADTPGCVTSLLCGNGTIDADEDCDDGPGNSDAAPDACRTTCLDADCGDGVRDDGEECDDGNERDGDGCDGDCAIEDGCDADCTPEEGTCGNGIVEDDEECDDGNANDADGCDSTCTVQDGSCGDAVVEGDEECDEAGANSDVLPDRCRTDCTAPSCGDDVVDPLHAEQCEPPGTLLCTEGCGWRVPALPVDAGRSPSLASCQRALLDAGIHAVARTRAIVGRCVRRVGACVLGRTDAPDACFARAERSCLHAAGRRDRVIAKLVVVTIRRCDDRTRSTVSIEALLRSGGGLGFATQAAACPFAGDRRPAVADLVACVLDRARCIGERLVGVTVPRARELLDEIDVDADERFPCIPDLEASGSPSGAFVELGSRGGYRPSFRRSSS